MSTKKIFSILFCFLPFFAVSQEVGSPFNYELGFGVTGSFPIDLYGNRGTLYFPIYGSVSYQFNRNYKIGSDLELFTATSGNRRKEWDDFHNFFKLNLNLQRRIRLFSKDHWIGLGIQTGSSPNLYQRENRRFSDRLSEFLKWMNSPVHGIRLKWQKDIGSFTQAFEFNYLFDEEPYYFGHKIGVRLAKNRYEGLTFPVSIDSFYNKWNILVGTELKIPLSASSEPNVASTYLEVNYKPVSNYTWGMSIASDGEDLSGYTIEEVPLDHLWNYGIHLDRNFPLKGGEVFLGLKLAQYHSRTTTQLEKEVNTGLAFRAGYHTGCLRHFMSYNFTGKEFPNYISYSFGINFGWSKYYR